MICSALRRLVQGAARLAPCGVVPLGLAAPAKRLPTPSTRQRNAGTLLTFPSGKSPKPEPGWAEHRDTAKVPRFSVTGVCKSSMSEADRSEGWKERRQHDEAVRRTSFGAPGCAAATLHHSIWKAYRPWCLSDGAVLKGQQFVLNWGPQGVEARIIDPHPRRFADPQDDSIFHPRTWHRAARLGQVSFHFSSQGFEVE